MGTTNYFNTFIEVAEDCPVIAAEVPPQRGNEKTVAALEYEMLIDSRYVYTSDDVIFTVYAQRNKRVDTSIERETFFAQGRACLRSSPLPKRYGWGVHSNAEGKIAIYPLGSEEYQDLAKDPSLKHLKAMRSKRA